MTTAGALVLAACLVAAAVDGLLKRADERRCDWANVTAFPDDWPHVDDCTCAFCYSAATGGGL